MCREGLERTTRIFRERGKADAESLQGELRPLFYTNPNLPVQEAVTIVSMRIEEFLLNNDLTDDFILEGI